MAPIICYPWNKFNIIIHKNTINLPNCNIQLKNSLYLSRFFYFLTNATILTSLLTFSYVCRFISWCNIAPIGSRNKEQKCETYVLKTKVNCWTMNAEFFSCDQNQLTSNRSITFWGLLCKTFQPNHQHTGGTCTVDHWTDDLLHNNPECLIGLA